MNLMQMLQSGSSPKDIVMNQLSSSMSNNPMGQNLLQLAQQGRGNEIEQIARNLCQSRGMDFDKEFRAFKQSLGFK